MVELEGTIAEIAARKRRYIAEFDSWESLNERKAAHRAAWPKEKIAKNCAKAQSRP
jgi:hypothetical protein